MVKIFRLRVAVLAQPKGGTIQNQRAKFPPYIALHKEVQ